MKTLLLLRHAKSSWKDADLDDHERPLNKRGKREAPRMGRLLREEGLLPDFIVVSSAKRARKTADHIIEQSGYRGEVRITGELYEAGQDRLVGVLKKLPDACSRVLLIGHNPGLEELLERMTGSYTPLSTAALAHLVTSIDSWTQLSVGSGANLIGLWQPKELD